MKQVEKFFKEDFKEHICFSGEESKNIKYAYETGFRKALELVLEYIHYVDIGSSYKWLIDLESVQNLADKEVE